MPTLPQPRKRILPWTSVLVAACLQVPSFSLSAQAAPGVTASPLPATAVDAIPAKLDDAAKQKLMATGSYSSFFKDQPKVDLCPSPAAADDIMRALNESHPNMGVQTLVVAAMPAHLLARSDRNLVLYNLLHQFRTMEGIQYYSASHAQMRVFFTKSYAVKGPGDLAMLPDPQYPAIEPSHEIYLVQDDSTFGKNLYTAIFRGLEKGAVELTMSNVEKVKWGLFPVLAPGALKLTMVIQPSADGRFLYFYGNVGLKAIRLPGIETTVRNSFYNRTIAYYNWFAKQAAKG